MKTIVLLLVSCSFVACFFVDDFSIFKTCPEHCALPITWDHEEWACGTDNNSYKNALCNSTLSSVYNCLIKNDIHANPNVGIVYPGQCGCPLYCSANVNQGSCQNGVCECSPGWSGIDCSMVTDGNTCSGRGTVITINGFKMCECINGYAGNDCSVIIGTLPPIDQTIKPVQQYSDWDDYQNENPIFNDTTIAQIYLKTAPETLAFFLDPVNIYTDVYLPADMVYYNGIVTEVMDQVGYRIKGGASRGYAKKSFKIAFDEYVDRKWAQQKKIGLKAMEMDPSALKEKLTESLLYSMNAPAQRSSYAQFFINDQFMGIYLILENIDDQFLKSRFGNEDGLLYKCTGDLAYLGWNPEIYKNLTMGRGEKEGPTYEAQTDAAEDYTLLRDFIFVINITDDNLFATELEKIFDVDLFVRTLAVEVLTGNWDGLWNGNNYFLYYNPTVSKFQYFRQDLDVAFGVWDTFYNMINKPVYTWGDGGRGYRLINRVLANPAFKASFTNYCYQLINTYFKQVGSFSDRMFFINEELRPIVAKDKWRETDYAWSFDEFASQPVQNIVRIPGDNWITAYPEIIDYGLQIFMEERIRTALAELDPPSSF